MKKEKHDDVGEITCTNQPPSPSLEAIYVYETRVKLENNPLLSPPWPDGGKSYSGDGVVSR